MIKGQKLQIYSADQFLAPLYLQKMDNITCREKVQLLPIITQRICLFQKKCGWIPHINHDFPEVNANLPLPKLSRAVFWSGQITVGVVPMLLKHFGIQTHWYEPRNLLLTSFVLASASTSPPLTEGTGANPFPSLHEHLVHINCKTHIRLQSSDSWGKAEKEEWQLSCSKAFIRRWGQGGCLEHTQTSWIHLWGWCNRAHPCASWFA